MGHSKRTRWDECRTGSRGARGVQPSSSRRRSRRPCRGCDHRRADVGRDLVHCVRALFEARPERRIAREIDATRGCPLESNHFPRASSVTDILVGGTLAKRLK